MDSSVYDEAAGVPAVIQRRGLVARLRDFFALRQTNSQNPTRGQRVVYVESTIAGVRANPDTVLESAAVWACVNVIAKSVAQLPWRLHKLVGPDSSEIAPGAIDDLLNVRPNPEMSAFTFRETLLWHLELWGNCYAEIERDAGGRPIALWPIEPDRVTPRRYFDDQRTLYYQVRNEYGPVTDLDPADMFHIHGPGWNGNEGYRTTAYAAQSLGLTMALERYAAAFFGQGAQLGGVITNKNTNLNDAGRRALLAEFNQRHQGPDKAHRWQYLDGNMDAKPLSAPPNDAQMIESRGFQVMEVCRWFGVPPHKIADLTRATNNNIEHQGIEFVTDGVLPRTVKFEQEAAFKLLGRNPTKQFTRIDVRSLQRGDLAGRSAFYQAMFDRGVFSPNDIRHQEGMNPLSKADGGDKRFVMINMQTLDTAGAAPATPASPKGGEKIDKPGKSDDEADPNAPQPDGGSESGGEESTGPAN